MEEKVNIFADVRSAVKATEVDASQYSPLSLAYLGDTVYELFIRTRLVGFANRQVNKLNKLGSELAMARTQAAMLDLLEDVLTEEERVWIQRGKNAKVVNIPKSATAREYHKATGFEALLGYLYLCGRDERVAEIITTAWDRMGENEGTDRP